MELEYFRANKGKDFGPVTDKSIAKNVDDTTYTETGNGGSKPDALHNAGPHGVPVNGL